VSDGPREDPAMTAAMEEALALAALPPPAEEERRVVGAGGPEVLRTWRRRASRRRGVVVGLSALAAAAAVAAFAAFPWMVRRSAPRPAPVAVEWTFPDLDAAWEASALVEPEGAIGAAGAQDDVPTDALFAELAEIDLEVP
jgi:hypothetical protein